MRTEAVVHVDLDGARHVFGHRGWAYPWRDDPVFLTGMPRLLDFLEANRVRATLFAVASSLESPAQRELLERAVAAGHEIASHSLDHPEFDRLDRDGKRREIAESRERLEGALRTQVRGFRTPNWQVDREVLELLEECGYAWDSSLRPEPAALRRLGVPALRPVPHRPLDGSLLELPLPGHRPAPFPFHPSYALMLGERYFEFCLRRFERTGAPLVLVFHLIDFADPLPRERLPGPAARLFTLSHLRAETKRLRCQRMLDRVRGSFRITDTESLVAGWGEGRADQSLLLGISTTHETGAALFEGRRLRAAVCEERLDRVKFSTRFPPTRSIEAVLREAEADPRDIGDVVVAGLPPAKLARRLLRGQLRDTLEFHGWIDYFPHLNKLPYRAYALARALGYRRVLSHLEKRYGIRPRLHFVPHHLCHAASAYRTAPFDDALIVTADGVGDGACATVSRGRNGRIELLKLIPYPHSFGQFYTACTQLLGFRGGRHEGKVTGLAAYGEVDPVLYRKLRATIRRSGPDFTLDKRYYSEGFPRGFSLRGLRRGEDLFEALDYRNYKTPLRKLIEGQPRERVAAVFQRVLEEELEALVRPFAERTGLRNLCLAGGVFANVKANTALFRSLGFDEVYVYPHMGDGGLAPGAVLELLQARPVPFDDVYWGPGYDEGEMERALAAAAGAGLRFRRESCIEDAVAERLAGKRIVARFDGRMEFGPRALGNRSILCAAGDRGANDWLNARLGRTEFMPFAPVVMAEHAPNLFKDVEGTAHASQFMTMLLDCTDWTVEHCPAVVHVDGTARPQLVHERVNPGLHRILARYDALTGIPLLVNTSFNMHEEPIVCSPEDAVRAFLSARLDYLAMGPFLAWIEDPGGGP